MPSAFSRCCNSARRSRERPLALVERRLGLVALALGRVAAELLALILAERVVAQRLLVAQELAELVDLLAHFAARLVLLGVLGAAHVLEHVLHFVEHRLGVLARAVARHVFHAVEHRLEILLRQLGVGVVLLLRRLLGEVAHVALGGVAQFLGQLAQLLVARAALQRLAQLAARRRASRAAPARRRRPRA